MSHGAYDLPIPGQAKYYAGKASLPRFDSSVDTCGRPDINNQQTNKQRHSTFLVCTYNGLVHVLGFLDVNH